LRSGKRLAAEREHSRAQIEEERRVVREREQLAEAYAVHVVLGETSVAEGGEHGGPDGPVKRLAVIVVNHGAFTITGLEAQSCYDGVKLGFPEGSKRLTGFGDVRELLRRDWNPSAEHALDGVLTPRDAGVRFESYLVPERELGNPIPWCDGLTGGGRGGSTGAARSARCAMTRPGSRETLVTRLHCAGTAGDPGLSGKAQENGIPLSSFQARIWSRRP
jgi:hypothetical protein